MVISNPWLTWFKGAFLPALVGLAVTPLILYQVLLPFARLLIHLCSQS